MASLECISLPIYGRDNDLVIVFIHGLNGDQYRTWMKEPEDDSSLWPRWLSEDFECPVWLLEYDAAFSNWREGAMPLPDQADSVLDALSSEPKLKGKSLLLVGHSMGGLVIKTAILHGQTKGVLRYKEIVDSVKGIIFIATPHKGSQLANLAEALSSLLRVNPQVSNMAIHDPHLRSLNQQFINSVNEANGALEVRTFSETKGVFIGKRIFGLNLGKSIMVVDSDSSDPNIANEIPVRLSEDHISISKLSSRSDQMYKSICAFIGGLIPSRRQRLLVEEAALPKTVNNQSKSRRDKLLELRKSNSDKEAIIQDIMQQITDLGPLTPEELGAISPISIKELEDMGVIYFDAGRWKTKGPGLWGDP